jgi:hypothetical protein
LHQPDSDSDTEDEEEEEEEEIPEEEEEEETKEVYDDEDSEEEEEEEKVTKLVVIDAAQPGAPEEAPPANCDTKLEDEAAEAARPVDSEPQQRQLEWQLAYSGPDRATDLRDLNPAAQYQLRVCAINAAGASPFSGSVVVETPASVPGAVPALTPLDTTASSLCFKFKKPPCHGERIEEYTVEWTDKVTLATQPNLIVIDVIVASFVIFLNELKFGHSFVQCCGSGMFYPGSGSDHCSIPDPGGKKAPDPDPGFGG